MEWTLTDTPANPLAYIAEIQVVYLDSYDLKHWGEVCFAKEGDACFDLRVTQDVTLHSGVVELVGTGIRTAFAPDYVLHIYPRSGMACKHQITLANAPATIDSGYRGEIKLGLLNTGNALKVIKRGERVAQARLSALVTTRFKTVNVLDDSERGEGGFGSTGCK